MLRCTRSARSPWRHAHHVTADELATLLGVDVRTVQRWEAGEAAPRRGSWPQLDAFERGDLILVRTPAGAVLFSPAAEHLAWRSVGATIRRVGLAASPVERVLAAVAELASAEDLRAVIRALEVRAEEIGRGAPPDDLTISHGEITVAGEVAEESPPAVTQPTTQRGPGRPRLAGISMTTRSVQLAPEHEDEIARLMDRGLTRSAAVRVLIGRGMGRAWAEDPDAP